MTTYSIIGAGSSSGNPVTVFVGCESSTNICWIGRETVDGYCAECTYHDDQYCSGVTVNNADVTTGTVTWSGASVYYKIVKDCEEKPLPQSCSTYTYSDFSFYTVPTYVEADYDGYIDIYYSYTVTCLHVDGSIGGIDNLSDMESVPFSSFTSGDTVYTYDFAPISDVCSACSGVAQVYISSDEDTCDSGTTVNVTTTFSPSVVPALPASGTDVTISIRCKTIEVDEDCTKRVTNTSSALTWHVSCATDCCIDHVVSSSITVSDIRAIAGVDRTATIKYNGVKVISTSIPYSITQKAKYTEECSGSSDDKETKYCVDSGSVKVEYETAYLSNRWTENGVVPFGGGRIKVSWNYSACTDSLCTPNTWEEIIEVESCDEREESPGDGCIYTSDSDGRVSGSCVLYFKEQSDDCGTCEGESPGEGYGVFNKITYNFEQDCQTTCQDYTTVVYDKKTITVGKCFTGTTSTTVPYSSITEHIGVLCPSATTETGNETVEVNITSINNSDSARTIFESDKVIVQQEAGPCSSDTQCGVAVKVESGLEGTDTAFLGFTDTEGTAQYNARNGELIEYYTDDNDGVSVTIDSDPDNNEDYRYKLVDGTDYITGLDLDCGESASTVAVKYCGCKKLKGVTGETAITADSGDSITVAIYSATCDSLNLEVKHVSGDEVLDLSVAPVFNSDSTLTAKVSANESTTSEREGRYVIANSITGIDCLKGRFTIKQEKKTCPEDWGTGTATKNDVPAAGGTYTLTSNIPHTSTTCVEDTVEGTCTVTIPANTSFEPTSYTDTVDATIGGETHGKITYTVNQLAASCDCSNMNLVVGSTITLAKEADSSGETTITSYDCAPYSISITSDGNWLDAEAILSENKVVASSSTENTSAQPRSGTIKFIASAGSEPCSTPVITVTQSGQEAPTCGCNSITFNGGEFEEDEYEGIPVYRIELDKSSQRITAATIDSDCTPRNRSLDKYETITTNNAWDDIVNGDSTPGDTELILVINANNASSSREGYGKIMYDIDGTECTTIIHLVQSGTVTVCDCNNVTWKGTEEADPT